MNKYEILLYWSDEDKAFIAEVPDLPGCAAHGKNRAEAIVNAEAAMALWVETTRQFGERIPKPSGKLLTVAQAAQRLSLGVAMVRRYCANGQLPATKIGRDWAILQTDIEAFAAITRQRGKHLRQVQAQLA